MLPKNRVTTHPGEILHEEFIKPLGLSQSALARALGVGQHVVNEIVHARRGISAVMALKLAKALGTSAEFWSGLQMDYELTSAKADKSTQAALDHIALVSRAG